MGQADGSARVKQPRPEKCGGWYLLLDPVRNFKRLELGLLAKQTPEELISNRVDF